MKLDNCGSYTRSGYSLAEIVVMDPQKKEIIFKKEAIVKSEQELLMETGLPELLKSKNLSINDVDYLIDWKFSFRQV